MTRKWEYKVLALFTHGTRSYQADSESKLNALGDAGWELVTVVFYPESVSMVAALKREKA